MTLQALTAGIIAGIIWASPLCAQAQAPAIWFIPGDNLPRNGKVTDSDFMQLFAQKGGWPRAIAHINVFGLNPLFPAKAPDDELRSIFAFVHGHHMALETGMQVLPGRNGCGKGVEGMTAPGVPAAIARRVRQLGGQLDYLAMDEPMMFGHEYNGDDACRFSIHEVAERAAESLRQVQAIFPNIQVGDAEPVSWMRGNDWASRVAAWLDAWQRAFGKQLAFFQEDPNWSGPWRERAPVLESMLHERGIQYGVMFTTTGSRVSTDEGWIAAAQRNIRAYEVAIRAKPDQVIFTSWDPNPSHVLPETAPTTLTYLVNWYFDQGK